MKSFTELNKIKPESFKKSRIFPDPKNCSLEYIKFNRERISERLAELDKLRGTGYWDFHYQCLYDNLYDRYMELSK